MRSCRDCTTAQHSSETKNIVFLLQGIGQLQQHPCLQVPVNQTLPSDHAAEAGACRWGYQACKPCAESMVVVVALQFMCNRFFLFVCFVFPTTKPVFAEHDKMMLL